MIRVLVLIAYCLVSHSFAQKTTILGVIQNNEKEAVSGVSVLLKKDGKIKSFTRTDGDGKYLMAVSDTNLQGSVLETSHLAYANEKFPLKTNQTEYNFVLTPKDNRIEEISIGRPVPIRQRKDTLSFSVRAFADSMDRSIGDVLRRMPGFDVSESGKINFNGQDISHFFIDGDDVLGSRYGLGTRNIPHDIIAVVDIYRNYQAIKALDDKVNSNKIALNLNVKDDAKAQWIGEVKGGLGLPQHYLVESNVLRFDPKLKTLNAVMANNAGNDVELGMQNLTQSSPHDIEQYVLRSGSIQAMNENMDMFFENHSFATFSNLFLKLKKEWTVRSNLGFYADKRLFNSFTSQQFDVGQGTFETNETIDLSYKPIKSELNLNLMRNVDKMYVSNNSKFSYALHQIADDIHSTELSLAEKLKQRSLVLENDFNFIPRNEGQNFWRLGWHTVYKNVPESLRILGDTLIPILSSFEEGSTFRQNLTNRTFHTKVDWSYFMQTNTNFSQDYGLEASYENKILRSGLSANNYENMWSNITNFDNDLRWNRAYVGGYGSYQYNRGKLRTNFKLPLGLQSTNYNDPNHELNERSQKVIFAPNVNMSYALNPRQSVKMEYFSTHSLGRINDVYRSFILTDFRSISSSNASLPQLFNHQSYIRYAIENPAKMSFWNFSYGLSVLKSNVLNSLTLIQDAIEMKYTLDNNTQYSQEIGMRGGKYVKLLASTSSFEVQYKVNDAQQIINGNKQDVRTNTIQVYPQIGWKVGDIQGRYSGLWAWSWTGNTGNNMPNKGHLLTHNASLTYSLQSKVFLTAIGSHVRASNSNYQNSHVLLNSSLRYKASRKTEYGLQLSNILNQRESSIFIMDSGYSFYQQNAHRSRMVIFTVQKNF